MIAGGVSFLGVQGLGLGEKTRWMVARRRWIRLPKNMFGQHYESVVGYGQPEEHVWALSRSFQPD